MFQNHLDKNSFIYFINISIGLLSIIVSICILLFFVYIFIEDCFSPGVMRITGFSSDMVFSTWVYLILLIYAGGLILKLKPQANYFYQFILIGFIIEFICYKFVLGYPFNNSIIFLLFLVLLLYFNLPIVKKVMNVKEKKQNKLYLYGKIVLINLAIITISIIYFIFKYRPQWV